MKLRYEFYKDYSKLTYKNIREDISNYECMTQNNLSFNKVLKELNISKENFEEQFDIAYEKWYSKYYSQKLSIKYIIVNDIVIFKISIVCNDDKRNSYRLFSNCNEDDIENYIEDIFKSYKDNTFFIS